MFFRSKMKKKMDKLESELSTLRSKLFDTNQEVYSLKRKVQRIIDREVEKELSRQFSDRDRQFCRDVTTMTDSITKEINREYAAPKRPRGLVC